MSRVEYRVSSAEWARQRAKITALGPRTNLMKIFQFEIGTGPGRPDILIKASLHASSRSRSNRNQFGTESNRLESSRVESKLNRQGIGIESEPYRYEARVALATGELVQVESKSKPTESNRFNLRFRFAHTESNRSNRNRPCLPPAGVGLRPPHRLLAGGCASRTPCGRGAAPPASVP